MGDPELNGAQENLFGNYIIQRGLANAELRDEIFAQVANQVRGGRSLNSSEGGRRLLGDAVLSACPPRRFGGIPTR